MGQKDQMWILTSGGKQAERTRKKWSECYPWSVPVCGCVCVGGGGGRTWTTNTTYETRNEEVLQQEPSRSPAQLRHGCKNSLPPPAPPRGDAVHPPLL